MSQCQSLSIPRIGSVTVRHSRIRLADRLGSGYERDPAQKQSIADIEPPSRRQNRRSLEDSEAEDQNWSLVELLGRSASAKSPRGSKSAAFLAPHGHGPAHRRLSKPETANYRQVPPFRNNSLSKTGGPARLWRRPDMFMAREYSLNESHEDTDYEDTCVGSESYRPISSTGSSISWADDAMEAEQSETLAKLWNEVETVCAGGERPPKMSDDVYEECLLWRRGFPTEASTRPSRFESMEEFLEEIEDDGDITPTNDTKRFPEDPSDLIVPMRMTHSALDQRMTPHQNQNKRTDFVTSWLSSCKLHEDGDDEDAKEDHYHSYDVTNNILHGNESDTDNVVIKSSHFQPPRRRNVEMSMPGLQQRLPESDSFFKQGCRTPSFRLLSCSSSSRLPRTTGSLDTTAHGNTPCLAKEDAKARSLGSTGRACEEDCSRILNVIDEMPLDTTCTTKGETGPVAFHVPREDKVLGRQNSGKPFMLWLFDRDSPT